MAISPESTLSQESLTDSGALGELPEIANEGNLGTENYVYVMLHKSNSALVSPIHKRGQAWSPCRVISPSKRSYDDRVVGKRDCCGKTQTD